MRAGVVANESRKRRSELSTLAAPAKARATHHHHHHHHYQQRVRRSHRRRRVKQEMYARFAIRDVASYLFKIAPNTSQQQRVYKVARRCYTQKDVIQSSDSTEHVRQTQPEEGRKINQRTNAFRWGVCLRCMSTLDTRKRLWGIDARAWGAAWGADIC